MSIGTQSWLESTAIFADGLSVAIIVQFTQMAAASQASTE
jgi:hypothetical protein